MYFEIYKRYASVKPPFHNHVLRGNYDLAAESIMKIIQFTISMINSKGEIYCCSDGLEEGYLKEKDLKPFPINHFDQWLSLFTMDDENRCMGLFDLATTFYLRVGVESLSDISLGEVRSGFFELYGYDGEVLKIYEALKEEFKGFFIMESAKKHLDEISG